MGTRIMIHSARAGKGKGVRRVGASGSAPVFVRVSFLPLSAESLSLAHFWLALTCGFVPPSPAAPGPWLPRFSPDSASTGDWRDWRQACHSRYFEVPSPLAQRIHASTCTHPTSKHEPASHMSRMSILSRRVPWTVPCLHNFTADEPRSLMDDSQSPAASNRKAEANTTPVRTTCATLAWRLCISIFAAGSTCCAWSTGPERRLITSEGVYGNLQMRVSRSTHSNGRLFFE